MKRLTAILNVAAGLIISVNASQEVVGFVCEFLVHEFPLIRSFAAEKLYVRLLETEPDLEEDHIAVKQLLHHSWESDGSLQEIDRDTVIREILMAFGIDGNFCLPAGTK